MKKLLSLLFSAICLLSCSSKQSEHFITDKAWRDTVMHDFEYRQQQLGIDLSYALKGDSLNIREQEALTFLYAYMPLADITDYPQELHIENVRTTFLAQEQMPWGKKIPEYIFRHFVLPARVNNENLDESRTVFYEQLKSRVENLPMKEAILEVNHWCHEHVTYQPSNARTTSPIVTMRNSTGRCGEESTFTVAALRSVGIPARQVYTPRWAHTDDNHAWVEAWADGKWYFLGACEPEPVLNLGWFNEPASRALLVHTRAFGRYAGPEEVILSTSEFTEINVIDNYAKTSRIDFDIVDMAGKKIKDAKVEFKIYNYAEFFTAVTKYTDDNGHTFLTAGNGDMLVWASKGSEYGFQKASFGTDKHITITLSHNPQTDSKEPLFEMQRLSIVPPPSDPHYPEINEDAQNLCKQRFEYEDSIRAAYAKQNFITKDEAAELTEATSEHIEYLVKARANWTTIWDFISEHADNPKRTFGILSRLAGKDLTDITIDVLNDAYEAKTDQLETRVENEPVLQPYKKQIASMFDKETTTSFRRDPNLLAEWIKTNIRLNPDAKAMRITQSALGGLQFGVTDSRSRDIMFVDIARSLNIRSRKDDVTGKVQYMQNGKWIDVCFSDQASAAAPQGTLHLEYDMIPGINDPRYYSHFTISRIKDGQLRLLSFDEGDIDMGGGTSYNNTFKNGVMLDEGTYLLVTGIRQANGSVNTTNRIFNIRQGKTTNVPLVLPYEKTDVCMIGNFNSELRFMRDGQLRSFVSQTGRGFFIVGIIKPGQEPTNHALRDICKRHEVFDKWGRPIVLLFESEQDVEKYKKETYGVLPKNIIYGIDTEHDVSKHIALKMQLKDANLLPLFIVADTFNNVVFVSQGYTISLGEQLEQVITHLD